jgi:Zn-dependent protease
LINLVNNPLDLTERIRQAGIFTIALEITILFHSFGHILSGKMVHSAMDELLIASTRHVNLYLGDQSLVPGSIHVIRSLGGPLFNILVAGLCYILKPIMPAGLPSMLLASLISVNLFFGLGGLLPIPTVDGEVIWREIIRSLRAK